MGMLMAKARLILGDALESLRGMESGSVDAVVTDPPYGVRDDGWDRMTGQEFARFSMGWLAEARRVGKEMVAFCSAYGPFRQLCEMLWPRVRVMVWDKPLGSQYAGASECGLWFAHETILHCYTPEKRTYTAPREIAVARAIREGRERAGLARGAVDVLLRGKKTGLCYRWEEGTCLPTPEQASQLAKVLSLSKAFSVTLAAAYAERDETMGRARQGASGRAARARDVFTCRTETNAAHPCQKPLPLVRELIERLTAPGGLVLDPFAGSGTTGVACLETGRDFIGVEISPEYHAVAERRLAGLRERSLCSG